MSKNLPPINDALYRIKRGLSGYVSYLAACEMNKAFSEYVLYEPTLRILTARGFAVECEYPCPGYNKTGPGDHKKIDFVAELSGSKFALEMKWAKKQKINVDSDVEKLEKYLANEQSSSAYLCVFGRKSHIESLSFHATGLFEFGSAVYAEFGVTKYGCKVYKLKNG